MKKTKLLPVVISVMMLTAFSFWGCNPNNSDIPNYKEFIMQIDSIQHPSSIPLGRNLTIKFYGTIGPDGCYTFSRFSPSMQGRNINVTVYGKQSDATSCDTAVSYLYGAALNVTQLDTGRYIIHVSQPVPPDIYDTVYVQLH
jgi:hypothetical protein